MTEQTDVSVLAIAQTAEEYSASNDVWPEVFGETLDYLAQKHASGGISGDEMHALRSLLESRDRFSASILAREQDQAFMELTLEEKLLAIYRCVRSLEPS